MRLSGKAGRIKKYKHKTGKKGRINGIKKCRKNSETANVSGISGSKRTSGFKNRIKKHVIQVNYEGETRKVMWLKRQS